MDDTCLQFYLFFFSLMPPILTFGYASYSSCFMRITVYLSPLAFSLNFYKLISLTEDL
jgi:hypothetical protein